MYKKTSDTLKRRNNSLIIHLGELHIGTSRHRALLLKWLADVCDLPCRMLRGEFYLGERMDKLLLVTYLRSQRLGNFSMMVFDLLILAQSFLYPCRTSIE